MSDRGARSRELVSTQHEQIKITDKSKYVHAAPYITNSDSSGRPVTCPNFKA